MMLAYKGFNPGLVCRGYQFKLGRNITDKANCRANGFHCAENPLDCLTYYSNMDQAEYYLVDAGGDVDEDELDSKIACTELNILQMLDRQHFFLHTLAYMVDHPTRAWNSQVRKDIATAENGYAIVRGAAPVAQGNIGDILAFAKENPLTGKVVQIGLTKVDGKQVRPGKLYDINLKEQKGTLA